MIKRFAAIAGIAVFAVLAGVGIGTALWSSTAQTTGTARAASLATTCAAPTKLLNGGFESPNIGTDPYRQITSPFISGWSVVNDNVIEIWRSQLPSTPPENAQILELNGNAPGTVYQVVSTTPGQVLRWSLKHRGREGNDTMAVAINANNAALVQQAQFTTGSTTWSYHEGVYVVPAGQTSTRLSLVPISTYNNQPSIGNLVDDVTFGSGPCLSATGAIANITTGGSTYKVGDVVEYTTTITNAGGAHSSATILSAPVPAGLTYVPGTITIDGVARTDASGDDAANYASGTVTARLGQGATASAGGAISPANVITIKFRATVQSSAAGNNLNYTTSTAYLDPLATGWPLTAVSPTLTTPVAASADIAVAVQSAPTLNAATAGTAVSWVMRVTNTGPSTATGLSVALTVPANGTTGNFLSNRQISASGGMACGAIGTTTATCTLASLASGASVDITFTGTMPAAPTAGGTRTVVATASTTTTDPVTSNNSATSAVVYDGTAPTTPTGLSATRNSATQINLSWTASTDTGTGIAGYRIYRNGTLVATTTGTGTTYNDTGLPSNTPYWYWVVAVDGVGNASGASQGDGAVTYKEATSYRIQNQNTNTLCAVADSNGTGSLVRTQTCGTATAALRQFNLTTVSGDSVYIRFQTGTSRGWYVGNDTATTDVSMSSNGNLTNARSQWTLGATWNGSTAFMEIRRSTITNMCVEVTAGSTSTNAVIQQDTCDSSASQRFALLEP